MFPIELIFSSPLYIVVDFFIHELWTRLDCKRRRYLHMISNTRKEYSFAIEYVCCFVLFKTDRICLFITVVGQKILWECCQCITTYTTIWYFIQTHFFKLGGFSFLPFRPVPPPRFSGFLCSLMCLLPVNVLEKFWCIFLSDFFWKIENHFYW